MKLLLLFSLLILGGLDGAAFDRLYCQSNLKDWLVTLSESANISVLSANNKNTSLTDEQSQTLVIKDIDSKTVITLFPWHSLYVRIPKYTELNYIIKIKEVPSGFLIEIVDKKIKTMRNLNCRFTF